MKDDIATACRSTNLSFIPQVTFQKAHSGSVRKVVGGAFREIVETDYLVAIGFQPYR